MSHNWKNNLVSPDTSLKTVIEVINKGAIKLALVVDDENKLLGTVTDGDIRRAIIYNIELDADIAKVIDRKSVV